MKLTVVAGLPGSGKTSFVMEAAKVSGADFCFIANNKQSAESMSQLCGFVDDYPFKSPCARVRQFKFRVDKMRDEHNPDMIISEPPGSCQDVSAPMLNPIYVAERGKTVIGPLILVIDGESLKDGKISKRDTAGLRTFNMVDESDVVVVSSSGRYDDCTRASIKDTVFSVNPDAELIFFDEASGEGTEDAARVLFGDMTYNRPLVN